MLAPLDSLAPRSSNQSLPPVRQPQQIERSIRSECVFAVLTILAVHAPTAFAINGFFIPGYGPKSLAVAGTGVAMPQDRLAAAVNPAGMALVKPGLDASALMLHPQREGSVDCTGIGACDREISDRSKREFFVVPGFGYSHRWSENLTLGVSMYANGGLNTSYGKDFYAEAAARIAGKRPGDPGFPTRGKLGVDFSQVVMAPSAAYRINEKWTIGIAPLILLQKFSVRGLGNFAGLSADATSLSNRGADYEIGGGVRVGAIYQLLPNVRLGAQYSSPIFVHHYTKYNGLFVDGGVLDSPAQFTVGAAWTATSKLTVAFDFQRILYGDVDTIGNSGPSLAELNGAISADRRLGGSHGIGFGWTNQSVYKLGVIYQYSQQLTLRLGWNHCDSTVPSDQALLAPLVPAPMQNDLTAGLSFRLGGPHEVSIAYMHSFGATTRNEQTNFFNVPVKAWAAADGFNLGYSRDF